LLFKRDYINKIKEKRSINLNINNFFLKIHIKKHQVKKKLGLTVIFFLKKKLHKMTARFRSFWWLVNRDRSFLTLKPIFQFIFDSKHLKIPLELF